MVDRRTFLQAMAAAAAATGTGATAGQAAASTAPSDPQGSGLFPQGIASGDPRPDGTVVWTRVDPPLPGDTVVGWEVATDATFADVVANGTETAGPATDRCVHAVVGGLAADRWYAYRFRVGDEVSRTGRLRTAPSADAEVDHLRFVFASCQQINDSHYVAHRAAAAEGADFFLHLGDYVYVNDHTTLTLDDYRAELRRFKTNAILQDCHAAVPFVLMWDDGEFWNGVDARHDPFQTTLDHRERQQNGIDAYFEYMPLQRSGDDPNRLYRSLAWGDLADLLVLDVRSYRDAAVDAVNSLSPEGRQMMAPGRTTLGAPQKTWLKAGLAESTARWRLLGNGYNFNWWRLVDLDHPLLRALNPRWQHNAGIYAPNEAWDDYQAERLELLAFIEGAGVRDVVSCAGHTHLYFAGIVPDDIDSPSRHPVLAEFTTGSLTADPDPRTLFGGLPRQLAESLIHLGERFVTSQNPWYSYVNFLDQGYALVDLTPDELVCEFRLLDTFDPAATARTGAAFRVRRGSPAVERLA